MHGRQCAHAGRNCTCGRAPGRSIHDAVMDRRRAEGKLFNLEKRLDSELLPGTVGIAHTRWAT
ncbi:hypothetical protein GR238_38015, partial [Rhizobium leguminosarum]|nr:hypothetical protein [Rhizobium ruizarguesonis]